MSKKSIKSTVGEAFEVVGLFEITNCYLQFWRKLADQTSVFHMFGQCSVFAVLLSKLVSEHAWWPCLETILEITLHPPNIWITEVYRQFLNLFILEQPSFRMRTIKGKPSWIPILPTSNQADPLSINQSLRKPENFYSWMGKTQKALMDMVSICIKYTH